MPGGRNLSARGLDGRDANQGGPHETLGCGNYGTETVQADALRPGDFYTLFMCQGIYKSTDYGQTWHGPINTGESGAAAGDCAGGITIAPHSWRARTAGRTGLP